MANKKPDYYIVKGFYFLTSKEASMLANKLGHDTGFQMDCFGNLVPVPVELWVKRFWVAFE